MTAIYCLHSADPGIKNNYDAKAKLPNIDGLGLRMWWATAEQVPGDFDFSSIIAGLKACQKYGKKAHVTILAGIHEPKWLLQRVGKAQVINGSEGPLVHPSNEHAHGRYLLMMKAFCKWLAPYESLIEFIHIGGPQCFKSNEIHMKAKLPKATMVAAWKQGMVNMAEATSEFAGTMPLCLNFSKGYSDSDGIREAVAADAFKLFPKRLRMQHNALDGKTNTGWKTHSQLIDWRNKGVSIGFEAVQPSTHSAFDGTLKEAIALAEKEKGAWFSVYQGDATGV